MALDSETAGSFTGGSDSSQLSMFVVRIGNPVDSSIVSDTVMGRVTTNDLVVLVSSVLSNPVTVQHPKSSQSTTHTLLSLRPEVTGWLELVDTDRSRLTANNTLGDWSLPASSSDSGPVDDVTFFGLEAKFSGLVDSGRVVDPADDGELSVLPGPDSEDEVHEIRLFLPPKFFEILVGSHLSQI